MELLIRSVYAAILLTFLFVYIKHHWPEKRIDMTIFWIGIGLGILLF